MLLLDEGGSYRDIEEKLGAPASTVSREFVAADLDQRKLVVRNFDAGLISFGIQLGVNLEAFRGGRRTLVRFALVTLIGYNSQAAQTYWRRALQ